MTGASSGPGSQGFAPQPATPSSPVGVDPSREIERLYSLAKANNALARMNAKRADDAEAKLAEQEGLMEWCSHQRDEALAKRDTMYVARQKSERALDRVKVALRRRSFPTIDPVWSAAFNAALDMVNRALRDSDASLAEDPKGLSREAVAARADEGGIAQPSPESTS